MLNSLIAWFEKEQFTEDRVMGEEHKYESLTTLNIEEKSTPANWITKITAKELANHIVHGYIHSEDERKRKIKTWGAWDNTIFYNINVNKNWRAAFAIFDGSGTETSFLEILNE